MAAISFIRGKHRVQVRRAGTRPFSRSFQTRREAERWARQVESAIDDNRHADSGSVLFGDLIRSYREDIGSMGRTKTATIALLERELGGERLSSLTPARLVRWAKGRGVSPATMSMDMGYIGTIIRHARAVRQLRLPDPVPDARVALRHARLVGDAAERDRRPTDDEIERLCAYFDAHSALPMRDVLWFAIHSAMRLGEILRLQWRDLDRRHKTILVRDRKDPRRKTTQSVPLLDAAMEIIERQPRGELIFPYDGTTVSSIFPRACRKLGIKDLRFHDLRHEGTSRLFEMGYQIQEVALFTGHKSWSQLRRYTQLKAATLRRL